MTTATKTARRVYVSKECEGVYSVTISIDGAIQTIPNVFTCLACLIASANAEGYKRCATVQLLNIADDADTYKAMRVVVVHYSDGSTNRTNINGTRQGIEEYYLGQTFDMGDTEEHPTSRPITATAVEFLD